MKYLLWSIMIVILHPVVHAQTLVRGKVMVSKTKEAIAYVNIGIEGSSIGTISNTDGTFLVTIPEQLKSKKLVFSAIGFSRKELAVMSLDEKDFLEILLQEIAVELKPITINEKRVKNKTYEFGNTSYKGGVLETDTMFAGRSMSLLINNEGAQSHQDFEFPVYLEKASLRILKNNLDTLKFRVRINEVDALTREPSKDILMESIVVTSTMRRGWLDFDLSHLNFVVSNSFYLTFEQILDVHDRTRIADGYSELMREHPEGLTIDTVEFEGKKQVRKRFDARAMDLPGTIICIDTRKPPLFTSYVRETSLANWVKVNGIMTATVVLSNQRK